MRDYLYLLSPSMILANFNLPLPTESSIMPAITQRTLERGMNHQHITLNTLQTMKTEQKPIAMLTAYDASFAKVIDATDIDVILVGDSLGNVIQGEKTTLPVTLDDMCYHTHCVSKATDYKFVIADMPFMSYASVEQSLDTAAELIQAGAMMVKMEGGAWLVDHIAALTERGIPVCAHLGLTPQSIHKIGGYKQQGKNPRDAEQMLEDALTLEKAGAGLLVLECVPSSLAEEITNNLSIPTIGIGAGPHCDGQVLVCYDILGISQFIPSFSHNFLNDTGDISAAIAAYALEVKQRLFPAE